MEDKDKAQEQAAQALKDDLHRVDNGEAATFDDIQEAADQVQDQTTQDVLSQEEDVNATLRQELDEARQALEKEKKEYLFLMADFDNFRKRVVKEKADLIRNASERVLGDLLPIVDDFERGLQAVKDSDDAQAVKEGMELIYNKLVKLLASYGVKAMDSTGTDFDADLHEAIATVPASEDTQKGKVIDTTQRGYTLNDKVLRHAKVVVGE